MKTNLFAISGRQDAPRALVLLSSGSSADDVVAPAEELRDTGVKITAIGLGKQANVRELINIASEPKSEHVFTAFLDTLPNAMDDIVQEVCRGEKVEYGRFICPSFQFIIPGFADSFLPSCVKYSL